ncbi:MAG: ribbon-helix-helix protein, CopG family [Gammaproteobacteria bacterium]|nr:MAG: ribbon-helix-helix protein, CopG family [Gammaproteobacteria bacterium]
MAMTAISLKLPERLARESKALARELGISRTELIRRALYHEMEAIKASRERAEMRKAMALMKEDEAYQEEAREIDEGFSTPLPRERDRWWEG